MFSYAFARYLQLKRGNGEKIAFDMSDIELRREKNIRPGDLGPEWDNYMPEFICNENVIEEHVKKNILQKMVMHRFYSQINKNGGKLWGKELQEKQEKSADFLAKFGIYQYTYGYHDFEVNMHSKNLYLIGFFESPRYFKGIDDVLRKDFTPQKKMSENKQRLLDEIMSSDSTCIEVRRGEKLNEKNKKEWDVCGIDYYIRGAQYILQKKPNTRFFVSSDDIDWCKANLIIDSKNVKYIDKHDYDMSPQENLYIMTFANNFVMSNSAFSWWEQHLSTMPNKIVIAPRPWVNIDNDLHSDIYEDNWTILEV